MTAASSAERHKAAPTASTTAGMGPELDFRTVYERHFDAVWHSLRRLSVPEKQLMDAAQDVFVVVYRRLPEFEGRAQLRTWLFQICRRVASNYRQLASTRREVAVGASELRDRLDQTTQQPDAAAHAERLALARAVLDKLPEPQREAFILYELEERSGEEIAAELGVPVGTVRSRVRLARQAFRREVALLTGETQEQKAG